MIPLNHRLLNNSLLRLLLLLFLLLSLRNYSRSLMHRHQVIIIVTIALFYSLRL